LECTQWSPSQFQRVLTARTISHYHPHLFPQSETRNAASRAIRRSLMWMLVTARLVLELLEPLEAADRGQ
jgi:hypothetical protein